MKVKTITTNDYIDNDAYDTMCNLSTTVSDKIVLLRPQNLRVLGFEGEELKNFINKTEDDICNLEYANMYITNDYLIKKNIKDFYSVDYNAQIIVYEEPPKGKKIYLDILDYKLVMSAISKIGSCTTVKDIIVNSNDNIFDEFKKDVIKIVSDKLLSSIINYNMVRRYIKDKYSLNNLKELEILFGEQAIRG